MCRKKKSKLLNFIRINFYDQQRLLNELTDYSNGERSDVWVARGHVYTSKY